MRAPEQELGQGARRLCATCGKSLSIKPTGRTRQFCSDLCRDEARRAANFRDFGTTVPRRSGVTRNPIKTSNKSTAKSAISADRGSAVKAVSPIVAIGLGIGTPNACKLADHPRADLIRRAIAIELAARWRR